MIRVNFECFSLIQLQHNRPNERHLFLSNKEAKLENCTLPSDDSNYTHPARWSNLEFETTHPTPTPRPLEQPKPPQTKPETDEDLVVV